jgi:hypothetical protein
MKKKILSIIICTLLTAAILIPSVNSQNAECKPSNTNPQCNNFITKIAWSGEGNNLDNWGITPTIDLSGYDSVDLEITTLYEIFPPDSPDYGYIKISSNGGSEWTTLETFQGYTPEWTTVSIDLQEWVDENIKIAFEFTTEPDSGGPSISEGWWIDNIIIHSNHERIYEEDFSEYDIDDPWGDWVIIGTASPPNVPPFAPSILGPTKGGPGKDLTYTFSSTDWDLDNIFYYINWGDGTPELEWIGPYESSEAVSLNHTFTSKGTYTIEAKAKDINGEESKIGKLKVTIEKSKSKQSNLILSLQTLERLLDRILQLFPIFNKLIEFPMTN